MFGTGRSQSFCTLPKLAPRPLVPSPVRMGRYGIAWVFMGVNGLLTAFVLAKHITPGDCIDLARKRVGLATPKADERDVTR